MPWQLNPTHSQKSDDARAHDLEAVDCHACERSGSRYLLARNTLIQYQASVTSSKGCGIIGWGLTYQRFLHSCCSQLRRSANSTGRSPPMPPTCGDGRVLLLLLRKKNVPPHMVRCRFPLSTCSCSDWSWRNFIAKMARCCGKASSGGYRCCPEMYLVDNPIIVHRSRELKLVNFTSVPVTRDLMNLLTSHQPYSPFNFRMRMAW
jgi:hypothetical protein